MDDKTVLCLLDIADRFNAVGLKANCFSYISQHEDVAKSELFFDLSKPLQVCHFQITNNNHFFNFLSL